jgi:hypothetical protein
VNEATPGQSAGTGATGAPAAPDRAPGRGEPDIALALQLVELAEGELDRVLAQLDERIRERDALAVMLDAFLGASGLGHAVVTADGRIDEWSERATIVTGLAPRVGARLEHDLVDLIEHVAADQNPSGWQRFGDFKAAGAPLVDPAAGRVLVVFDQAGSEARHESTARSTDPNTEP